MVKVLADPMSGEHTLPSFQTAVFSWILDGAERRERASSPTSSLKDANSIPEDSALMAVALQRLHLLIPSHWLFKISTCECWGTQTFKE